MQIVDKGVSKGNILLVEDDAISSQVMSKLLSYEGWNVTVAKTVKDSLLLLENKDWLILAPKSKASDSVNLDLLVIVSKSRN